MLLGNEGYMAYFPMFIRLEGCSCLVVGGGSIAWHKACVLMDFGAEVTVVAREFCHGLKEQSGIVCQEKEYHKSDLAGMKLVVAATSDEGLDHQISEDCRELGIPVNAVDQQEDCDFIFPSYVRQGDVVAAFSSGGQSPLLTQYLKSESEAFVTPFIGRLSGWLGQLRPEVKRRIHQMEKRKAVYAELFALGLEKGDLPTREETENVILRREAWNGQDDCE